MRRSSCSSGSPRSLRSDDVRGVFAAVAPIVGTPHILHAAGNIYRALGIAYELDEMKEFEVTEP
jgi:hypothetical protein